MTKRQAADRAQVQIIIKWPIWIARHETCLGSTLPVDRRVWWPFLLLTTVRHNPAYGGD